MVFIGHGRRSQSSRGRGCGTRRAWDVVLIAQRRWYLSGMGGAIDRVEEMPVGQGRWHSLGIVGGISWMWVGAASLQYHRQRMNTAAKQQYKQRWRFHVHWSTSIEMEDEHHGGGNDQRNHCRWRNAVERILVI